jgi:CDP-diacylglycerol--glycerol-3-phosphate 3-phosphatidyltransferase
VRPETGDSTPIVEPAPADTAPADSPPTDTAPTNAAPTNAAPTNAAPTNAAPTNAAPTPVDRVWTVPNLLSLLRLLGVPLFLWLLLGPHADLPALGVLAFAGLSDYADGKLARALNQTSRLGILLDPAADRLYILATLAAFSVRDIIPWWLAGVIVGRDVVLGLCLPVLRRYGYGPPPVHFLGKAATFNLLYAFPLLLLGTGDSLLARIANPIGWAFAIWGTALYLWAGALYLYQVALLVRAARRESAAGPVVPEARR